MEISLKDKIDLIHKSDMFGVFIETGVLSVLPELMKVSGSSNTIFAGQVPYNREFTNKKYPDASEYRAVSFEVVREMMKKWIPQNQTLGSNIHAKTRVYKIDNDNYWAGSNENISNVNTVYASSFQIGDITNEIGTHGWIGVWHKGEAIFFHIDIQRPMSRGNYISNIGEIGVNILFEILNCEVNNILKGKSFIKDCCINMIKDIKGNDLPIEYMFNMLTHEISENFIAIKNEKIVRLEDLFRGQEKIILYKGSFNPVHHCHDSYSKVAEEKYGAKPVMMIAMEIYQKGFVEAKDMVKRVEMLNELGYSVIVSRYGYFNKNIKYIRNRFKQPIVCIVGTDTFNRIIDSSYKLINRGFDDERNRIIQEYEPKMDYRLYADIINDTFIPKEVVSFKKDFNDVHFFIINRPGSELIKEADLVKEYWTFQEENKNLHWISSTQIRESLKNKDFENVKKMVPKKIYEKLIKNK